MECGVRSVMMFTNAWYKWLVRSAECGVWSAECDDVH